MSQAAAPKQEDLRAIKERLEKKLSGPFQLLSRQDVSDYLCILRAERKENTIQ
jgi:hypothetical protein